MIDLHCHVLPGIDDGPATMAEALALGRVAEADGTRTVVATPHVSWECPNDSTLIAAAVDDVNQELAGAGIGIAVLSGAEVALSRAGELAPRELAALRLGGGPWLLVECPFSPSAVGFQAALFDLQGHGHRIVLAHPERCPAFARDPELLARLVASGMLTSITAGALVGRFGKEVTRFARRLVAGGLVHNVASDAHDHVRRPPGVLSILEEAGLADHAPWLTEAVPRAILQGGRIPPAPFAPPPQPQTGRRWWSR